MKKKATKKRKMLVKEKKVFMDTLLAYEEEQRKIDAAQQRLYSRKETLNNKRDKICKQLSEGIKLNNEEIDTPIFYKGKYFQLDSNWQYGNHYNYSVEIKDVKKL